MSALILLVEDDPALLSTLQAAMTFGGFESETVASGHEAIERFRTRPFDAVLIDLGLPDVDGSHVLETLREISDVPLLVVSGRGSESDKIAALDQGADDFIPKPFLPGELLARIRAALRRHRRSASEAARPRPAGGERDPVAIGALVLDPFHRSVALGGNSTVLSEAEYKILSALARSRDEIVSKSTLLKTLYDTDALEETRIVEVYISNIRRKLRSLHPGEFIFNARGRGWRLVIPESTPSD